MAANVRFRTASGGSESNDARFILRDAGFAADVAADHRMSVVELRVLARAAIVAEGTPRRTASVESAMLQRTQSTLSSVSLLDPVRARVLRVTGGVR